MSRFRLFGRPNTTPGPPDAPASGGPPPGWGRPPPAGAGAPWPTAARSTNGPATWSARPAPSWRGPSGDPPTDPFGFPPVPAVLAPPVPAAQVIAPAISTHLHPADAAALAGAFATDYLSWDEDNPERRGRALIDYLPTPGSDPARLGWSGRGRQRADFALPGRVRPDGDGRVLVEVRVRVTPYRSVGEHGTETASAADTESDTAGTPSSAPAPTGRGWRSLSSHWIRLSVPVASEGGRLVVDASEETLGEEPPAPAQAPDARADDHTLADDDPLVEPRTGGAW